MVGMGEIKISRVSDEVLTALGLGSCIGVCMYDPISRIAGMAHVVLPAHVQNTGDLPGKYATTAIPALLESMQKCGAKTGNLRVAIAGGAQIFSFAGASAQLDIGKRNAAAVEEMLARNNLPIHAQDVGGNMGRTIQLHSSDGRVSIKTIGGGVKDLVILGDAKCARVNS
jgi:chemotaxis protein CheD